MNNSVAGWCLSCVDDVSSHFAFDLTPGEFALMHRDGGGFGGTRGVRRVLYTRWSPTGGYPMLRWMLVVVSCAVLGSFAPTRAGLTPRTRPPRS